MFHRILPSPPPSFTADLPQQIMDCQAPPVAAPMPAPAAPASLRPSATRELSEPRRTQVRLMVEGRAMSWVTFFVCIPIFIFTQDTSCDTDNAYNIYTYCMTYISNTWYTQTQQVYVHIYALNKIYTEYCSNKSMYIHTSIHRFGCHQPTGQVKRSWIQGLSKGQVWSEWVIDEVWLGMRYICVCILYIYTHIFNIL